MAKKNLRITGITGVVAGGTGTFAPPVGPRYFGIKLGTFVDGVATAASTVLSRIRLKMNSVTIWDVSVARLMKDKALGGVANAVGELSLDFADPSRADKVDERLTAWDTFGERSFEVELVCAAAPGGVPSVNGVLIYDNGATVVNGQRVKTIVKKLETTRQIGSGYADIDDLEIRHPIQRLLIDSTQAITEAEVTADGVAVWQVTTVQNARFLADYGLDATQFTYPLCFDYDEQLSSFLEVRQTLNVRLLSGAAATVTILQETLAPGFV